MQQQKNRESWEKSLYEFFTSCNVPFSVPEKCPRSVCQINICKSVVQIEICNQNTKKNRSDKISKLVLTILNPRLQIKIFDLLFMQFVITNYTRIPQYYLNLWYM